MKASGICALVDVRSAPYSRYATWFNHAELQLELKRAGIRYYYAGKQLGGRPDNRRFYDRNGYVLYSLMAQDKGFLNGVAQLRELVTQNEPLVVMCSEENPVVCHRGLLISRVLQEQGVVVKHILGDGSVKHHSELVTRQLSLWEADDEWKSIRSVLHQDPLESSLP